MNDDHPVRTKSRELTPAEATAHVQKAFDLERVIKVSFGRVHQSWWTLAEHLYTFHEGGYWSALGYETLNDFLAQPDLGMSRTQFFRMTQIWGDLVVIKQIAPAKFEGLEPSKVREVAPAITRGDVSVSTALADCRSLGTRDLREKYGSRSSIASSKQPLAAENEPARVQCAECGSWFIPGGND